MVFAIKTVVNNVELVNIGMICNVIACKDILEFQLIIVRLLMLHLIALKIK